MAKNKSEPKKIESKQITSLQNEVLKGRKEYITDNYSMSLGELVSMYKNKEITITPAYQRLFRWTLRQQSRLIESILIGVPLPPIFVYQTELGVWEVVDGVQRICSVFAFMGVLSDEDESSMLRESSTYPTILEKTKILPSLDAVSWLDLPPPLQLDFKRAKIDVKIIKSLSDKNAKYEVFQRLNSGGTLLSEQEFRNCVLIMINKDFFEWLDQLANTDNFKKSIELSESLEHQKYHHELALRLFVFAHYDFTQKTVNDFIDDSIFESEDSILNRIENKKFNLEAESEKFEKLFSMLYKATAEQTFKKSGQRGFLESYFEAIAVGLYHNLKQYDINSTQDIEKLRDLIKNIEKQKDFSSAKGTGTNSLSRIPKTVKFGKSYFKKT